MNAVNLGSAYATIELKGAKEFQSAIAGISSNITSVSKDVQKVSIDFTELGKSFKDVGKKMSLFVTTPLLGVAGASIKLASDFEQTTIAFTTMLGSAERASTLLEELKEFALSTPFSLPGIEASAKQLLAMGIDVDSLLPTLKSLGDVSAGLSVPLDRLAYNFGQVKAQGKLTTRELRDFATAGVPLIAELSKNLGVSASEVQSMVTAGEIGFDKVEEAFRTMTGEGGKFFDLMEAQSKTTGGQIERFKESVQLLGRSFGEVVLPAVNKLLTFLTALLEKIKTLTPEQQKMVWIFGAIVASIGPVLIALGTLMTLLPKIKAGFVLLKAGFDLLSGIATNPIVLLAIAIGVAIYLIIKHFDTLKLAFETVKNFIVTTFNDVVTFISTLPERIGNFFLQIKNWIVTTTTETLNWFIAFWAELPEKLAFILGFILGLIVQWGINTWNYLSTNIPIWFNQIVAWFTGLPARIWTQLVALYNKVVNWGKDTWNYIETNIPVWLDNVEEWFSKMPGRIWNSLSELYNKISTRFKEGWTAITDEIKSWPSRLVEWGKNIGKAFVEGIVQGLVKLKDAFVEGFNKARGMVKGESPPKEGPFKNIDQWGANTAMAWVDSFRDVIAGLSLPQPALARAYNTPSASIGSVRSNPMQSITNTHSPQFTVNIGTYAGSAMEKRVLAKELYDAYQNYQLGKGEI